jgi:hypothetical protein
MPPPAIVDDTQYIIKCNFSYMKTSRTAGMWHHFFPQCQCRTPLPSCYAKLAAGLAFIGAGTPSLFLDPVPVISFGLLRREVTLVTPV